MGEHRDSAVSRLSDPESWVDLHGDYLYRYAFSRIRDRVVAEDLVQETFLSALDARKSFRGRSSERTWLVSILRHKIIDHIRKTGREQPTEDIIPLADAWDDLFDTSGHWKVGPAKWAFNPGKLLERKEFWDVFYRCLSEMSRRLAQAFMLREVDGFKVKEICKVLDVTATNCWVILHRARMHMRGCLEAEWFKSKKSGKST